MSCSEWREVTLGDITDKIFSGGTPTTSREDYWNGEFNWLSSGETRNNFIINTEKTITQLGVEKSSTKLAEISDVVIASAGQGNTRGQVSFCKINTYINQSVIALRSNQDILEPSFLFYNLKGRYNEIRKISDGNSIRGSLTTQMVRNMKINLPSLQEQKAIANILSSLDEKIELNNQMNKTLEEMAQALFKRWFVDFEFPNENGEPYKSSGGEMVDSELGMIPKGWKVKGVDELVDSISKKHSFNKEKVIFLNTSDVLEGEVLHDIYSAVDGLPGQAKKSICKGDILYSEIRPKNKRFAYINFSAEDYVVSTKLMVLRAKGNIGSEMLYFYLTSDGTIDYLQMIAESRSGTFPQITFTELSRLKIAMPLEDVMEQMNSIFKSLLDKIQYNKKNNKWLTELRDTLLPKLMSGEIRVTDMQN